MTKTLRTEPKTTAAAAHDAARREFEGLMGRLAQLNADNFKCDTQTARQWGEVGSLRHLNGLLEQALEHYGIYA